MAERPQILDRFILQRQREASETNQCDHRSTFQAELDAVAKEYEELYERGLTLIGDISADDLNRCRKLCADRRGTNGINDLCPSRIKGQQVLVPKYVAFIEEVEKLRGLLQ